MSTTEDTNILISVVTPVFNGEQFVQQAYGCLQRQSYAQWEWVVVDDGSTDGTPALLQAIAQTDRRMRCFTQRASGSAKQPRDHAVAEARGAFVLPLDIDDRLADDYLEQMLLRQQQTNADIVYPHMVFIDMATGQTTEELPASDFNATMVYRGRDLVKETMPTWRIGCNGGLYRRHVWVNSSWPEKSEPLWMNSDEVDERLYQLQAQRVAFAQARYYYQNHADSITTRISPKLFHTLKTNPQLLDIIEKEFGTDSTEYERMQRKAFCDWRWKMALYTQHHRELAFADAQIHQNLAACFSRLSPQALTRSERFQFLGLKRFPLLLALFCLKYAPGLLLQKLLQRWWPQGYATFYVKRRQEKQMKAQLEQSYNGHDDDAPAVTGAFCLNCGNTDSGGLVDRLRGAVSVFLACQQAGRPFHLLFTHPFPLEDYLAPAHYDWRCSHGSVTFDRRHAMPVVAQVVSGKERQRHRKHMLHLLKQHPDKQLHFYTNADFCYADDFASAFSTLFRPSRRLQEHLEQVRADIGRDYITVSARFCNLLDDFNEEVYSEPLSAAKREQLLAACIKTMETLHSRQPQQRLVVCSDSTTFLQRAEHDLGAFVIPGVVSHIGNDDDSHDYCYYEKTFLDFFTIAGASHAYLLLGPAMHSSGFPYAAALSSGTPYEVVLI